jgi:hypothetical protein
MREFLETCVVGKIELDKSICVHNYKDFKKTEKGKKMIETYIDRWKRFGFIEGLEGEVRERCAVAMEQLAVYLLTENESYENFDVSFETIGFPMIRAICNGLLVGTKEKLNNLDSFNFEKFIKYCKELDITSLMNDVDKITSGINVDVEAETCVLACEMIIKRFNGDERSFDEMKTECINKIKEKIKNKDERASSDNTNE